MTIRRPWLEHDVTGWGINYWGIHCIIPKSYLANVHYLRGGGKLSKSLRQDLYCMLQVILSKFFFFPRSLVAQLRNVSWQWKQERKKKPGNGTTTDHHHQASFKCRQKVNYVSASAKCCVNALMEYAPLLPITIHLLVDVCHNPHLTKQQINTKKYTCCNSKPELKHSQVTIMYVCNVCSCH